MSVSRAAATGAAIALSGLATFGFSASASAAPNPQPTKSNCPNPVGKYPPGQCGTAHAKVDDDTAKPGDKTHVHGEGFKGNSDVDVEAHSVTVLLGTFRANGAGVVDADVTIPLGLSAGSHSLVLRGVSAQGTAVAVSIPITITKSGANARPTVAGVSLPATGAEIAGVSAIGLALVGAGSLAVISGRRRRLPAA